MIPINDLSRSFQLYQEEYEAKALEVLRSGWYILGKEVSAFEEEFAKALSPDCYCAGVDNGLDAILVGLMAAGIQPGDEIIVQANGYIATMLGIIQCGAVPVFVELPICFIVPSASTLKSFGALLVYLTFLLVALLGDTVGVT